VEASLLWLLSCPQQQHPCRPGQLWHLQLLLLLLLLWVNPMVSLDAAAAAAADQCLSCFSCLTLYVSLGRPHLLLLLPHLVRQVLLQQ
jgi:hypothetical protein